MKKAIISLGLCLLLLSVASCGKDKKKSEESGGLQVEFETMPPVELSTYSTDAKPIGEIEFETMPPVDIPTVSVASKPIEPFTFEGFEIDMNGSVAEDDADKFNGMSDADKQKFAEKKVALDKKLKDAFQKQGISVNVDSDTGEAMLDSSVLFGGDSAELTDDGKAVLQKFMAAYSSVLLDPEFDGFVSTVLVEGHTAPTADKSYEDDLPLSENRAKNVMDYCLSADAGISADTITAMKALMVSKGYSNSRPVADSSGQVDMAASRRVSFRFLLNLDA